MKIHFKFKKKILFLTLILFFTYFLINMFLIYNYGNIDEKKKCDVAIVLGASTNVNGVSPVYAQRINHAMWLYENNYVDYIIVTGGKGENMEFSDADKAKEYLVSKGIPESVIYTEDQSKITQQNLEFSKEIMSENSWKTCIIVSDPLHMKRAMLMAKDYDMDAYSSPTPTTKYQTIKTKLPFILREEFFYVGYKIYRLFCI